MQNLDQLTNHAAQMTMKAGHLTAKIVGDGARLWMHHSIDQGDATVLTLAECTALAHADHWTQHLAQLDTNCETYPDDVDACDTLRDQITQNLADMGLGAPEVCIDVQGIEAVQLAQQNEPAPY